MYSLTNERALRENAVIYSPSLELLLCVGPSQHALRVNTYVHILYTDMCCLCIYPFTFIFHFFSSYVYLFWYIYVLMCVCAWRAHIKTIHLQGGATSLFIICRRSNGLIRNSR